MSLCTQRRRMTAVSPPPPSSLEHQSPVLQARLKKAHGITRDVSLFHSKVSQVDTPATHSLDQPELSLREARGSTCMTIHSQMTTADRQLKFPQW